MEGQDYPGLWSESQANPNDRVQLCLQNKQTNKTRVAKTRARLQLRVLASMYKDWLLFPALKTKGEVSPTLPAFPSVSLIGFT